MHAAALCTCCAALLLQNVTVQAGQQTDRHPGHEEKVFYIRESMGVQLGKLGNHAMHYFSMKLQCYIPPQRRYFSHAKLEHCQGAA